MTTAKTKTTQHLSFALGGQLRGVYLYGQVAELVDAALHGGNESYMSAAFKIRIGSNPVLTTKLNTLTEQQLQTKIKRKLIERGWYVTKLIKTSTNGIPDLLAIKYGKAMFIEVKREGGRLSLVQKLRIEELKAAGAIVKVWTDYEVDFK